MSLTIREIALTDAAVAAHLSAQLGYPVSLEAIERRIAAFQTRHDHAVFVAHLDAEAVGWIDVGIVHRLQSEPYGEIGGLVVSDKHRGQGIGKQLIAHAELWMRAQGLERASVRSQLFRESAHRFYFREGYARVKTSAVFEKVLASR
jgi:GNAT superfamily N-acetyltransferase